MHPSARWPQIQEPLQAMSFTSLWPMATTLVLLLGLLLVTVWLIIRELQESERRLELADAAGHRAEDEAEELRCELAHAERVRALGELGPALAHELSQPLAAILRNAEAAGTILAAPAPDLDLLREIVADIRKDDCRAAEVVDRLRAFVKRRRLEFEAIAVENLVQEASSFVRADAAARQVTLECVVAPGLPKVSGDRVHLSQVLVNLIINGIEAIVTAKRASRSVTVSARVEAENSIELAVRDSGVGIPPDALARLFEPFFTTKASGLGLGLAVSRSIIEAHGGRLWAENNADGGATFHFTLHAAHGVRA
jgi:two-component system, LuxR family, sensor kinase FixL